METAKYPQRNRFEMQAHEIQFTNKGSLAALKEAIEEFNKPMFREDGKLNV